MPRIAFVGAGSTVFTRHLIGDVVAQPELAGSTFALMDIDPARLETSRAAAQELVAAHGAEATVEATLDRRAALAGADYVVTSGGAVAARATLARTKVLRDSVGPRIGVKAAGRFRTVDELTEAVRAGATRVSTHLSATLARAAAGDPVPVGASVVQ